MITDRKNWHYLATKSLSALLGEITSNHNGDFYCLKCFIHTIQKINSKTMKEYVMIMIIVT